MTSRILNLNKHNYRSQQGVSLMLAILVLAGITAVAFSIAAIAFVEIRASGDLLRTEPALYAVQAVTEEAFFATTRNVSSPTFSSSVNGVSLSSAVRSFDTSPQTYPIYYNVTRKFSLATSAAPFQNSYTTITINYLVPAAGTSVTVNLYQYLSTGTSYIADSQSLTSASPSWTITLSNYSNYSTSEFELQVTTNNPSNASVLITSNRTGSPSSGLPLTGRTAYDVTASYLGLTRKYTVSAPTANTPSSGGGGGGTTNWAAASNGATATDSGDLGAPYNAPSAIDGIRYSTFSGTYSWVDNTPNVYPDWIQVNFAGSKTISEVDVYSVRDDYTTASDPPAGMTFTAYGITAFDVQYWNGSTWVTVPGGNITGNNLVWRKVTFSPLTTNSIRVSVNGTLTGYVYMPEVEAY